MSIPKELKYIIAFLSCVLITSVIIRQPAFEDKNCSDFQTQEEAQKVFNQSDEDIHGLDRDKNGVDCQSLN